MAIYKSCADGGFSQLVPWMYLVTEQSECMDQFNVSFKPLPDSVDDVLCQFYSTAAAEMDEMVS